MELKEYIREVLQQVNEAITECNKKQVITDFIVNPTIRNAEFHEHKMYYINPNRTRTQVINVDFEVAVVASDLSDVKGRIGLSVLGIDGNCKNEQKTVNTVKFSLPVIFPSSETE